MMDRKPNYQKELELILEQIKRDQKTPKLLLHSCCAPCSSYVLEYLSNYFLITVYYFNPNISPSDEYRHRVEEQKRLIRELPVKHTVSFLEGEYQPERFYQAVKGLEAIPEGGERCFACYALRLREAAKVAKENGADYFTTTLSISPLKKAEKLNEIGRLAGEEYGVSYLPSDFKKRGGYQRSIVLSREYGLYRQNYCGCIFSRQEAESRVQRRAESDEV